MGEKQISGGVELVTQLMHSGRYVWNVVSLWLTRKISLRTVVHAVQSRPVAVAGLGGSYIVDPTFE